MYYCNLLVPLLCVGVAPAPVQVGPKVEEVHGQVEGPPEQARTYQVSST